MWVALAWFVSVGLAYYFGWYVGCERRALDREQLRLLRWQLAETRTQLYLAVTKTEDGGSLADRKDPK